MKSLFLLFFLLFSSVHIDAQGIRMRDLFAAMPDSLMPFVTRNNRLDCIDFMENHMEARVRNRLEQYVELKALTADYLLFQTSQKGYTEMKYVADSDTTGLLFVVRTCLGPIADSHVMCFNTDWTLIPSPMTRPRVQDFFHIPDEAQTEAVRLVLTELEDLPFLKASLSEDEANLTWEISLEYLSREGREMVQPYVRPVVQPLGR